MDHDYGESTHYCSACYAIDEAWVSKDPVTKVYLISTEEQYCIFADALYAARGSSKPMIYASASIESDLDFSAKDYVEIHQLYGRLHGNGHKISFGAKSKDVVWQLEPDAVVEYLDVEYSNPATQHLASYNYGQVIGCNVTGGMPVKQSYGLVHNCSGENLDGFIAKGRFTSCLVRSYTAGEADCYRLYDGNADYNQPAIYTVIPLAKAESGELAYQMSHGAGDCQRGQALGTDAGPRIYRGQTPASGTYVTRLTSYSAEHPAGNVEYMNAGMDLEAAPGCYKVCEDTESWTTHPAYNFIIDCGDGTYTAELINLDPSAGHYLPLEVDAERFAVSEIDADGAMVAPSYSAGDVVSLLLPVDMPVGMINGKVFVFRGYNAEEGRLEFVHSNQFYFIPAGTPMLVEAAGGSLLAEDTYAESYPLALSAMTGAGAFELDGVSHLAAYSHVTIPEADGLSYYRLAGAAGGAAAGSSARDRSAGGAAAGGYSAGGAAAARALSGTLRAEAVEAGTVVAPFASYFAIPTDTASGAAISVALVDDSVTGLDDLAADAAGAFPCPVLSLSGVRMMTAASAADLQRLAPGLYVLAAPRPRLIAITH